MKRYYEMRSESNDLPTAIRNRQLMTKQDLLLDICERRESILSALSNSSRHTTRYYSVMKKLLALFYERVEKTILPKQGNTIIRRQSPKSAIQLLKTVFAACSL